MKILICHFGEQWESLAATSLLKGLYNNFGKIDIYWATSHSNAILYKYNKKVNAVFTDYEPIKFEFDKVINLTPTTLSCKYASSINAKERSGFFERDGSIFATNTEIENIFKMLNYKNHTSKNIFQILFKIANMTWRGESYDLCYFPKTRTKKNKTGIAIHNPDLRKFVKENLKLRLSEVWHVPIKQDILKRIDEINRCKNIVTDDLFILHASIALRKYVEFLDIEGIPSMIEFFGHGKYYRLFADDSE